ncbi:MAG TPA: CAP domain-containing protein, partial [Syntrophales bacterium]
MTMIARILCILLLTVSFFGGAGGIASAAEGLPSPQDEALLALINQARQNPLAVAASMGMDPEKILKDLPELEKILREGLPPVTLNGNLSEAARAHTQDMFANGYYSHDSPDGRGYDARIRDGGYPAATTGETLGMLCFANFINPGDAVRLLFEYMFWDELDPLRKEKRNILDPLLKEAGVSVNTGVLSLGGAPWNVYLATCDFGAVISGPEARLFQLINEARKSPLTVAASLGMDPQQILADFPELQDLLTQGLSPLTFSSGLYKAARAHAEDMLANGYYSHDSLDGRTYVDRIRQTGYDPLDAGEYMELQCLGTGLTDETNDRIDWLVRFMFEKFFTRELRPDSAEQRNILNVGLKEVGISLVTGTSRELGGICGDFMLLMVVDFGLSPE